MKIKTVWILQTIGVAFMLLPSIVQYAEAGVVRQADKTYLVDQTGERWDISQAVSIGFDPNRFEFGIGRHAFNPLDETHLKPGTDPPSAGMRILGVAGADDAHAYSTDKLRHHETANTFLGSDAIVAGY